jgi:hypothetical protein
MGSWVWMLLGGGFPALLSLIQYVLRLQFLWRVYERGGREDLVAAGKVTTSPIEARRRKCHGSHGCHGTSINPPNAGVEEPA